MLTRSSAVIAGAVTLMLGVGACGRGDSDSATVSRGDVESTTALRVTEVELGRAVGPDNRVTDETDDFRPSDTFYASVQTTGTASGTLTARWRFQDGQVVDSTTTSITPTGQATTEFHISHPSGFPTGNYTLEVLLNGILVETKEFEVK